ncbi:hypothetical protein [Ethanoligenens sp.]|uniref:hypothetical protein n=1 Tax=Ethanoligenens sp. TaxID=2099655 RepID=UPI0039EB4D1F
MADYRKMYLTLFHAVTDTIGQLQEAQQKAEELYMQSGEPPLTTLRVQQEAAAAMADTPDIHLEEGKGLPVHKPPDHPHQHGKPSGKNHHHNDQSR